MAALLGHHPSSSWTTVSGFWFPLLLTDERRSVVSATATQTPPRNLPVLPLQYIVVYCDENVKDGLAPSTGGTLETTLTIGVTLLEEAMVTVTAAGGTIVGDIQTIPGVGCMVTCKDTEGNSFGLMEEQRPDQYVELGELSGV